jgi:hypothetical protein
MRSWNFTSSDSDSEIPNIESEDEDEDVVLKYPPSDIFQKLPQASDSMSSPLQTLKGMIAVSQTPMQTEKKKDVNDENEGANGTQTDNAIRSETPEILRDNEFMKQVILQNEAASKHVILQSEVPHEQLMLQNEVPAKQDSLETSVVDLPSTLIKAPSSTQAQQPVMTFTPNENMQMLRIMNVDDQQGDHKDEKDQKWETGKPLSMVQVASERLPDTISMEHQAPEVSNHQTIPYDDDSMQKQALAEKTAPKIQTVRKHMKLADGTDMFETRTLTTQETPDSKMVSMVISQKSERDMSSPSAQALFADIFGEDDMEEQASAASNENETVEVRGGNNKDVAVDLSPRLSIAYSDGDQTDQSDQSDFAEEVSVSRTKPTAVLLIIDALASMCSETALHNMQRVFQKQQDGLSRVTFKKLIVAQHAETNGIDTPGFWKHGSDRKTISVDDILSLKERPARSKYDTFVLHYAKRLIVMGRKSICLRQMSSLRPHPSIIKLIEASQIPFEIMVYGANPNTETISVFESVIPITNDFSTLRNDMEMSNLKAYDRIYLCGDQLATHVTARSLTQYFESSKIHVLEDALCTNPCFHGVPGVRVEKTSDLL